jgi:serine/threonine protein kinase
MDDLETSYRVDGVPRDGAARVFNARRKNDGERVIVKLLDAEYPSAEELAGLRHEFSILRRLAEAGAPVPRPLDVIRHGRRQALVLTPAAGRSLETLIAEGPVEPARFCRLAIAVTGCLEAVHKVGIVHKDVKPSHFFVDEASGMTTLIDFGLATVLTHERARPAPVDRLEGTFAYMAPEQTGRMNRSMDRRSDLYSLGVTLYELATGKRPFDSEDPLELIHAQLARTPAAPAEVRPELPPILSDIVMRLLEKAPDARYQTAGGLCADLERARDCLAKGGSSERFELGRDDHSDELD